MLFFSHSFSHILSLRILIMNYLSLNSYCWNKDTKNIWLVTKNYNHLKFSTKFYVNLNFRNNKKKPKSSINRYKNTIKKKNVQLEQILSLNLLWQIHWQTGNENVILLHTCVRGLSQYIIQLRCYRSIRFKIIFQINVLKWCKWWIKFGYVWQMQ